MTNPNQKSALVLFSGGQDSTLCLALALRDYAHVETIGFDYGQRHRAELDARAHIRQRIGTVLPAHAARLGPDHVLDLATFGQISDTAMTRERIIELTDAGLPSTFVPGRNLLFFTYAAAFAYRRGISVLVGGMCETDFSGYPDCRNETLQTLANALRLGMDRPLEIATPLMWIDKAQTWALAHELGGQAFVAMIVEETHTCYLGNRTHRHAWGYGCNTCPACTLRREGWDRWQSAGRN